jgi:hypothetical protein
VPILAIFSGSLSFARKFLTTPSQLSVSTAVSVPALGNADSDNATPTAIYIFRTMHPQLVTTGVPKLSIVCQIDTGAFRQMIRTHGTLHPERL